MRDSFTVRLMLELLLLWKYIHFAEYVYMAYYYALIKLVDIYRIMTYE